MVFRKTALLIFHFWRLPLVPKLPKSCSVIHRHCIRNYMEEQGNSSDLVTPLNTTYVQNFVTRVLTK